MYSIKKVTMLLGCLALTCSIAFQASATEKFKVITTFTIIADMAKNVAGDAAEVSSITKPGAEIHEYQPTPGDIKRAQGAQLILANGMNLELWFQRFYQHLNGVPEVIVSSGVTPVGITEGPYEGKPNPHAWMSPDNALIYVDNIRDALIKYDPANAQTYQRNADTYKAKITQTLAPLRKQIAELPENQRWMVTSEGAFSYLARDLGLRITGNARLRAAKAVRHRLVAVLADDIQRPFIHIRRTKTFPHAVARMGQHIPQTPGHVVAVCWF